MDLYNRILRSIEAIRSKDYNGGWTTIIIDDLSHLEIAAHGSAKHVLDFLQYCRSLTSEMVKIDDFSLCPIIDSHYCC